MEGGCRATGVLSRALNSANTAAWEETVESGNFLFLRKYISFWIKKFSLGNAYIEYPEK